MRRPARRVASIVDVRSGLHMGLYDHQYGTSTAESTLESKLSVAWFRTVHSVTPPSGAKRREDRSRFLIWPLRGSKLAN